MATGINNPEFIFIKMNGETQRKKDSVKNIKIYLEKGMQTIEQLIKENIIKKHMNNQK